MSTASLVLWTAILPITLGNCGHKSLQRTAIAVDHCQVCDAEGLKVAATIQCLQLSREWRKRDGAAHDLTKFSVRRHPEIVDALAISLMKDPHEEVREQAAESLGKLGSCGPIAHFALTRAAKSDPDHATRRKASKALKRFGKRCVEPCRVCSPGRIVIDPVPLGPVMIDASPRPSTSPIIPLPEMTPELEPAPPLEVEPRPLRATPAPVGPDDELPPPPPKPAARPKPAFPPLVGPAA